MTRAQSKIYSRKHDIRPMDNHSPLESLSNKLDASLFLVGTSNKKRPSTITIGMQLLDYFENRFHDNRLCPKKHWDVQLTYMHCFLLHDEARMFNHHLLDMAELNVKNFKPTHKYKGIEKPAAISKPALIFQGHCWEHDIEFAQLKSLLADIFRGPIVPRVNLAGLDRVIIFSAEGSSIYMRQYRILLKKSGTKTPIAELEECGPAVDFVKGRMALPADDVWKEALRQPKQVIASKPKNIEYSKLGEKLGRVHMEKQDIGRLQLRKVKALKRTAKERVAGAQGKMAKPKSTKNSNAKRPKKRRKNTGTSSLIGDVQRKLYLRDNVNN
eukprot:gene3713-6257_t